MSNSTERLYNQIDRLKKIKFGRKYVDKTPHTNGTFTFIPRDITVRDEEGRFLGVVITPTANTKWN